MRPVHGICDFGQTGKGDASGEKFVFQERRDEIKP